MAVDTKKAPREEPLGLKKLRGINRNGTRTMCPNCKCERYSPCGCQKRGEK